MIEIIQMDLGSALDLLGFDFMPTHPMLIPAEEQQELLALDPREGVARAFREISPEEAAASDAKILGQDLFEPEPDENPAEIAAGDLVVNPAPAPAALWHIFDIAETRWAIEFPGDTDSSSGKGRFGVADRWSVAVR